MTIAEAMKLRHSVRTYQDKPIPAQICSELEQEIAACNAEGGLRIQLVTNEKDAFDGFMAHYGKFSGVRNYIALIGKKSAGLEEKAGYYGERIALKAQCLGLNTCWVALTMRKGTVKKHCRNAAIALGNSNDPSHIPALKKVLAFDCEGVREAAQWAIEKLEACKPAGSI